MCVVSPPPPPLSLSHYLDLAFLVCVLNTFSIHFHFQRLAFILLVSFSASGMNHKIKFNNKKKRKTATTTTKCPTLKIMDSFSIILPLIPSNKQTERKSYCDLKKDLKKKRKKKKKKKSTKDEATLPQVLLQSHLIII